MKIRTATTADAEALCAIYKPYVEETAISFEYAAPGAEEFRRRIVATLAEYPYLVAEEDGEPVGYAYASILHGREAYRHSAETSIYVKRGAHGRGIGRALEDALEREIAKQNVLTLYACIAVPLGESDPYVTFDSVKFHEKMGFRHLASFPASGYKFDRWYTVVWMEKDLGEKPEHPEPFIPYGKL